MGQRSVPSTVLTPGAGARVQRHADLGLPGTGVPSAGAGVATLLLIRALEDGTEVKLSLFFQ